MHSSCHTLRLRYKEGDDVFYILVTRSTDHTYDYPFLGFPVSIVRLVELLSLLVCPWIAVRQIPSCSFVPVAKNSDFLAPHYDQVILCNLLDALPSVAPILHLRE